MMFLQTNYLLSIANNYCQDHLVIKSAHTKHKSLLFANQFGVFYLATLAMS